MLACALALALAGCAGSEALEGGSDPPSGGKGSGLAAPVVLPATGPQILEAVRSPGARAVLVNVWATWCLPCREEFPDLVRLRREYAGRGLRLILVSGDFESELAEVQRFLEEEGVDFPSYIKTGKDMEFIEALHPEWSGALPATFIYDRKGTLRHFWQEKATYARFEKKVVELLEESPPRRGRGHGSKEGS